MKEHPSLHLVLESMRKGESWVLVSDVDGVLTDGSFWYSSRGKRLKRFGSHDAEALRVQKLFQRVLFVSADRRGFGITKRRIRDMGQQVALADSTSRINIVKDFIALGFKVCFVGDSFTDLPAMRAANFSVAPAQSFSSAKAEADLVLESRGGDGALAELLLSLSEDEK